MCVLGITCGSKADVFNLALDYERSVGYVTFKGLILLVDVALRCPPHGTGGLLFYWNVCLWK